MRRLADAAVLLFAAANLHHALVAVVRWRSAVARYGGVRVGL